MNLHQGPAEGIRGQLKISSDDRSTAGHKEMLSGFCSWELVSLNYYDRCCHFFFISSFSEMVRRSVFNKHKLFSSFLERNRGMTGLLPSPDGGPFQGESSDIFLIPHRVRGNTYFVVDIQ